MTERIALIRILAFIGFLISGRATAQLHSPPNCGENFVLDWSQAPSSSNEYNWLPNGSLTNTYTNVDNSGIDITITFTGDTGSLGVWGSQTPKVGNSSSALYEGLDLYTTGFSATGITCTITFSSPIYALSFDMHHVNASGANGDKYTITGIDTDSNIITPVFTNSSTPSYTTDNSTGIVNAVSSSTSGNNAVVGVNFSDSSYITSVSFLWQDCDTCSPNNIHGSGLGNFSFCIPQTLDFDGVNDYINRSAFLGGKTETTMMSWVRLDNGFGGGEIMGQRNFRLYVDSNRRLKAFVKTSSGTEVYSPDIASALLTTDLWYHVALKFDGNSGIIELLLNGQSIWSDNSSLSIGATINSAPSWDSNHDFEIGRNTELDNNYFEGAIYECRVYGKSLTLSQLQQQIHQEIENNSGNVRGTVIPKDIEGLLWSDLELYYKMGIIDTGYTPDDSDTGIDGKLNNMRTYQERTAPIPYVTTNSCSGDWSDVNNWEYGTIWDIPNSHSEAAIIKINGNMETSISHETVGLILDSGATLTVQGDNEIKNSYYLELNGTLDLMGDSQLVQTDQSDLVTSADGKVLRRQEGVPSAYWYNYWASPVGSQGATSLADNNTASNNTNNTAFSLDMLRDDSGFNCSFTSDYTASGNISTYWLYTFINGLTYWDWAQIAPSTNLGPGVGYTQKGTGVPGTEQQYIFEGKPNNGTILISVTDRGGPGSVANSTKTEYLLGNPYPSALDVHRFIDDNAGVIDGTLQLWQQWSGSSHNLNEYNGGYAQVNKTGSVRAYQFVGFYGANNGSQDGTKTPTRYLPVGQGFITEIVADGTVEFNNGQRLFIKEADADGTYGNGSTFFKNGGKKSKVASAKGEGPEEGGGPMKRVRLEFSSVTGPDTRRELLLGFSNETSDAFDYGYDAESDDINNNDLSLSLEGKNMNIMAYGPITADKVVPLNFKSSGNNTFEIKISETENIEDDQEIYLKDSLTGEYFDLTNGQPYGFSSQQGKFNQRFEIVFQSEAGTLSSDEIESNEDYIYYHKGSNMLFAKRLNGEVTKFTLYSITGQSVMELDNVSGDVLDRGLKLADASTGAYVACFRTDTNQVITKKIIIN
ncbi:hypothetical protein [Hyunsoonleella rubra]|uniref:LamG-like jellyroll fold domain-containing protein n=1 Tax=Hyunsoonleella rubra TaxID=1737062 RepID=A0ABW5T7J6_9FLAO